MKRAGLGRVILLATLGGVALTGCERLVTGETYEGQLNGGRSMQVSFESPPRGATYAGAPAEKPASTRSWTVRESDPSIRGLLAASGARIVLRDAPRPRPVAPPPMPTPVPTVAADPTAAGVQVIQAQPGAGVQVIQAQPGVQVVQAQPGAGAQVVQARPDAPAIPPIRAAAQPGAH
jgi:hypothetical protein